MNGSAAPFSLPKKILFLIPTLRMGGSEQVVRILLQHFPRSFRELHLATLNQGGDFFSGIPEDVCRHLLPVTRTRYAAYPVWKLIRRIRPDTVISFLDMNLVTGFLKPFLPPETKVILREGSVPSLNLHRVRFKRIWKRAYKHCYRKADRIICQSDFLKRDLTEHYRVNPEKLVRIYNPVDIDKIQAMAGSGENPFAGKGEGPHIVSAGRLCYEKNFGLLIRAFPEALAREPGAQLWILGTGPEETSLRALRDTLGLTQKIHFVGFVNNPYAWLKHSRLTVLCSHYEGFPNILLEAISCGCPVLATFMPGGTQEILQICFGKDLCVPQEELGKSIGSALKQYGPAADRKRFEQYFSVGNVIQHYEQCIA